MDNNIPSPPAVNNTSASILPKTPIKTGFKFNKRLLLIGLIAVIILSGSGGFYLGKNSNKIPVIPIGQQRGCTFEAKICPDGTTVGREGPNCEFASCPTVKQSTSTVISTGIPTQVTENDNNGSCSMASSAALQGLPSFLQSSPDYKGQNGTIGNGYIVYSVKTIAKIANYTKGQKVSSLISPTQTCYFTVLINNVPTTDLTVVRETVGWSTVGLGGGLTKKVSDLKKQIPGLLQKNGINGIYSLKLIQIHEINLDFALIEADGKEFIASFSPPNWFNLDENTLYPADEAMTHYIQPAKDQIKNNSNPGTVGN